VSLCNKNWFFVTIYRRDGFTKKILCDLRPILASVCTDFESELIEFEREDDHVRLLVNYPSKVTVSTLVNSLKGIASLMIRKKNDPIIRKKLWGSALWSPSYFAGSCGGAPISVICKYIKQWQAPH
jgi:putative transposase